MNGTNKMETRVEQKFDVLVRSINRLHDIENKLGRLSDAIRNTSQPRREQFALESIDNLVSALDMLPPIINDTSDSIENIILSITRDLFEVENKGVAKASR